MEYEKLRDEFHNLAQSGKPQWLTKKEFSVLSEFCNRKHPREPDRQTLTRRLGGEACRSGRAKTIGGGIIQVSDCLKHGLEKFNNYLRGEVPNPVSARASGKKSLGRVGEGLTLSDAHWRCLIGSSRPHTYDGDSPVYYVSASDSVKVKLLKASQRFRVPGIGAEVAFSMDDLGRRLIATVYPIQ